MEKNELLKKIYKYKLYKKNYLLEELIDQFSPLLKKYSCKLEYEDTMQELTLFFIQLLNKIPIDKLEEDKYILAYISKSMKNKYLQLLNLSIKENYSLEYIDYIEIKSESNREFELIELNELLSTLNEREFFVLNSLYLRDLTIKEIAKCLNLSRQAVNQIKLKSLEKLKKELN